MASDKTGIMALPEADSPKNTPQLSLDDSYDAVKTALRQVSPEASNQVESTLSQVSSGIAELTPDQAAEILKILQDLYNSTPEEYKTKLAKYIKDGAMQAGDLPEEYDPEFLATAITLVLEARKNAEAASNEMLQPPEGPEGFAKGGIASAAKMLASKGRRGDTMLAHINPDEARLLKAHGGSGTINPKTGLPEYNIFSSLWKGITGAVKSVLSNPIGRIVGTIALATVLGPVVGTTLATPLASAGTTLLAGGDLKDALTSAAFSYLGGPEGPVAKFVSPLAESVTGFGPATAAGQAITSGLVGAGVSMLSGKSLADSVKAGLMQGAMTYGSSSLLGTKQTQAPAPVEDRTLPGLPTLGERPAAPELAALAGSGTPASALASGAQAAGQEAAQRAGIAAVSPVTPATTPPLAAAAPAAPSAPAAPGPAQTAPVAPKVPSIMDSLSQIGQGNIKEGLTGLFSPSLTTEQLKQTPEYLDAISKGRTVTEALQQATKANDPGFLRTYGPTIAAGIGAMGALGGFKQQPLKLSPEQQKLYGMMTGGPGSVQDLLRTDPTRYFIQNLPGVPYYGGSIYAPRNYADGGDVSNSAPMELMSGGSIPVGYADGGEANIPLMQKHYQQYWETSKPGQTIDWAGGKLTRFDASTAYYENPTTGEKILLRPNMDFGYIASQSPSIAAEWKKSYNFAPPQIASGTIGKVTDMQAAWDKYWDSGAKEMDWAGGKLVKSADGKSATYTGPDGKTITINPSTSFSYLANLSPNIAATWKTEFGYDANPSFVMGNQLRSDYSIVGVEQPGASVVDTFRNPYVADLIRWQQQNQNTLNQYPKVTVPNPAPGPGGPVAPGPVAPGPVAPGPVTPGPVAPGGLTRAQAEAAVRQAYGQIGRSGTDVGSGFADPKAIDQQGLEYWTGRLMSGDLNASNFGQTFKDVATSAAAEAAKKEDTYNKGLAALVQPKLPGFDPNIKLMSHGGIAHLADGGSPTAEDYAREQIKQWLNRDATAEEVANIARGITVDQNKPYATRVWYDPLGQRIEQPVFMTGPSTAQVVNPDQFVGAAEDQNIPYSERNAGQVLGKDNALYSTMEHGQLVRQTMDPARLAYMQDQAAKDAARLGPWSRGPFSAGPVNWQLSDLVEQIRSNQSGGRMMNMGGIAGIAQGGYPRRNGQISGPGTEKSDSIPAMLSDGEFVMTAKAVRGAGNGSRREGAKKMYKLMHQLERNASRG